MVRVCLFPPKSPLWQHQHYVIAFMLQNTWDGHKLVQYFTMGSLLDHSSNCSRSFTFINQIDYLSVFQSHYAQKKKVFQSQQLNYSAGCQLTKLYQAQVPLVQCTGLWISRATKKAKKMCMYIYIYYFILLFYDIDPEQGRGFPWTTSWTKP